jgi:hypothetical protein
MPILVGTWALVADGHEGTLEIHSVSTTGVLNATLTIPGIVQNSASKGFWNEATQALTLQVFEADREIPPDGAPWQPPPASCLFTGFQFAKPARALPGQDVVWTLVGHFSMFDERALGGPSPNARRHNFGWLATINQTV